MGDQIAYEDDDHSIKHSVPEFALIVLIGASGSGKSTFAQKWFRPTEVISSDHARALVSDDESNQSVSTDAFDIARLITEKRLKNRRLTVIDATNIRSSERRHWVQIAHKWKADAVAIVLDPGFNVCLEWNASRPDRKIDPPLIAHMIRELEHELASIFEEGFRRVIGLRSRSEIVNTSIQRMPA
jgi:protein phosphatase